MLGRRPQVQPSNNQHKKFSKLYSTSLATVFNALLLPYELERQFARRDNTVLPGPVTFQIPKSKKCNGDVNVTKLNSKTKFPVTFTSLFVLPGKGWGFFVPFHSRVSRGASLRPGGHFLSFGSFSQIAVNFRQL